MTDEDIIKTSIEANVDYGITSDVLITFARLIAAKQKERDVAICMEDGHSSGYYYADLIRSQA